MAHQQARHTRTGLTFVELIVVVAVLGILVGALLPRFGRTYDRLQTERAAFETAAFLRSAHALAVARRATLWCVFDPTAHRFQLTVEDDRGRHDLETRAATSKPLPPRVSVVLALNETAVDGLRFFPNGTAEAARISVQSPEASYHVAIDETTGTVSILERTAPP